MVIPQSFKRLAIKGGRTFRQIAQRIQHQPTHLTIRTLETLTRPRATFPQSRTTIMQNTQCPETGHASHNGAFAVQTVAPNSITD